MEIKKFEEFEYPRGWVNIKVDDEVIKRMSRYVYVLDKFMKSKRDNYDLKKKIDILSKADFHIQDGTKSIQDKISIITILQYLKEIVNNFNASSAGFLFEYFLAALIHGKKDENDYGKVDISTSYSDIKPSFFKVHEEKVRNTSYQIKLYKKGENYKNGGNIKISMDKKCDYYVICLKDISGKIDIHILSGRKVDIGKPYYILNKKYLSNERILKPILTNEVVKKDPDEVGIYRTGYSKQGVEYKYIVINTNKLRNNKEMVTLHIDNIESLIIKCGDVVKNSIELLYNQLSELHYDVDSLISGIDKNNKEISIDSAKKKSEDTLDNLKHAIKNIKIK